MQIEALRNFAYARQRYRQGDVLDVPSKDAHVLILAGTATMAITADVPSVEISPVTGKPKRRYKRRDMQAE